MVSYAFLLPMVCAVLSGGVIWVANRNQAVHDDALIRQFLLFLVIFHVLAWGISQTKTVRLRFDPQFKLQTEMDALPLLTRLRQVAPDNHARLQEFLVLQVAEGKSLAASLLEARPLLTRMAHAKLGWVDQKTTLAWARVTADTLRELQAQDPASCFQVLSMQMPHPTAPWPTFSAENSEAFQRAVIEVHESAYLGLTHQHPAVQQRVEFNAAAREYSVVHDSVAERFGPPLERLLAKKAFHEVPAASEGQMCAARIFQLEAMLARPLAMASSLLQSALR